MRERRAVRDLQAALVGLGLGAFAIQMAYWVGQGDTWNLDWNVYRDAALRFLGGGSYFLPRQLAGPYPLAFGDVLYPPTCLWLFVPFALLPALVWDIAPWLVILAALRKIRPSGWGWVAMAWLLAWPVLPRLIIHGNPVVWALAILFAAVAWKTPASLLLAMPTVWPFAFFGLRRRSWWIGFAIVVALSLPLLLLNLTWVQVILDTTNTGGPFYGIRDWVVMMMPLVALWSVRTHAENPVVVPDAPARDRRGWRTILRSRGPGPVGS